MKIELRFLSQESPGCSHVHLTDEDGNVHVTTEAELQDEIKETDHPLLVQVKQDIARSDVKQVEDIKAHIEAQVYGGGKI